MSIAYTAEAVTLWVDDDVPSRMVWNGRRWRVSDMPTPLEDLAWSRVTHPPMVRGWRFQATNELGVSFVFDVIWSVSDREWSLVRVYD